MKVEKFVQLMFGALVLTLASVAVWNSHTTFAQKGGEKGKKAAGPPATGEQLVIDNMYKSVDPKVGPVDLGLTDPAMVGAIDIHAHLDPTVPRTVKEGDMSLDFVSYAHMAKLRGLRGYVQKSHSDTSSAGNAYIVRKYIEPSLEVFGRFPMNFSTGGVNMATVQHFVDIRGGYGRIIEMPTWDAEYRNVPPRKPEVEDRGWMKMLPPGHPQYVSISKNGELLPEVKYIIDTLPKMRTNDSGGILSMATGHSAPEEDILLAKEAQSAGVLITDPHGADEFSADQFAEFTKLGGFIEIRNTGGESDKVTKYLQNIKTYGFDHFIISSDCGFMNYPYHTDCIALIAKAMRLHGATEANLDTMMKDNPAKLLHIMPWEETAAGAAWLKGGDTGSGGQNRQ